LALAMLMGEKTMDRIERIGVPPGGHPLAPKKAPLPAMAKHVIHIFAGGGPSHVDTWDPSRRWRVSIRSGSAR